MASQEHLLTALTNPERGAAVAAEVWAFLSRVARRFSWRRRTFPALVVRMEESRKPFSVILRSPLHSAAWRWSTQNLACGYRRAALFSSESRAWCSSIL